MKLTTMGRDTPTLKLRRRAKSKVDYGRDRDLDVEGENTHNLYFVVLVLLGLLTASKSKMNNIPHTFNFYKRSLGLMYPKKMK